MPEMVLWGHRIGKNKTIQYYAVGGLNRNITSHSSWLFTYNWTIVEGLILESQKSSVAV